jgi:hypothetical protein
MGSMIMLRKLKAGWLLAKKGRATFKIKKRGQTMFLFLIKQLQKFHIRNKIMVFVTFYTFFV